MPAAAPTARVTALLPRALDALEQVPVAGAALRTTRAAVGLIPRLHELVDTLGRTQGALDAIASDLGTMVRETTAARREVADAATAVRGAEATVVDRQARLHADADRVVAVAERLDRASERALAQLAQVDQHVDQALDMVDRVPGLDRPEGE